MSGIIYNKIFALTLVILGLTGMLFFGTQLTKQNSFNVDSTSHIETSIQPQNTLANNSSLDRSIPLKISIPSISVEVPITQVGLNDDKTIEVPDYYDDVTGWYKYGPTPGEAGAAVILGHVDNLEGPSVFYNLNTILPGEIITIERDDGKTVIYSVDRIAQFEQDNFPTEEVYGQIENVGLRLITCGGVFDSEKGKYSHNTVVFASVKNGHVEAESVNYIRKIR